MDKDRIGGYNMWKVLKELAGYYKPYLKVFFADLFFAVLGAGTALVVPLLVRYITSDVIYRGESEAVKLIFAIGAVMLFLVLVEGFCNFFIAYYGHIMGAKIEYDMRTQIFGHLQKLSFSFYDNQKVGQLMSRITNDLFEISALVASSKIRIGGFFKNTRAIDNLCFCPPESFTPRWPISVS